MNKDNLPRLLIATTNPAKFNEYRLLLQGMALQLCSLADIGIREAPVETGTTFVENALLKARFYRKISGLPTLADDGGLEIDALGGEPGVRSHRWIDGREASDEELIAEVLRRMEAVPDEKRTARLKAAVALIYTSEQGNEWEVVAEEALEGLISRVAYRSYRPGFPYRALLYLPTLGRFLAELDDEQAAQLSQRRLALERLFPHLLKISSTRPDSAIAT